MKIHAIPRKSFPQKCFIDFSDAKRFFAENNCFAVLRLNSVDLRLNSSATRLGGLSTEESCYFHWNLSLMRRLILLTILSQNKIRRQSSSFTSAAVERFWHQSGFHVDGVRLKERESEWERERKDVTKMWILQVHGKLVLNRVDWWFIRDMQFDDPFVQTIRWFLFSISSLNNSGNPIVN